MTHPNNKRTQLFDSGPCVMTPGVSDIPPLVIFGLIARHLRGDWGDMCDEDKSLNEDALKHGGRIFSSYTVEDGTKIWIITEADRSVTTVLLPSEY